MHSYQFFVITILGTIVPQTEFYWRLVDLAIFHFEYLAFFILAILHWYIL